MSGLSAAARDVSALPRRDCHGWPGQPAALDLPISGY